MSLQVAQQQIAAEPPSQAIKMEVGIEDCLHIEFEYDKQKYHLKVRLLACATFFFMPIFRVHFRIYRHCFENIFI